MQTYYVLGLAPKIISLDLCTLALFFEINKTADASLSKNVLFFNRSRKGLFTVFLSKGHFCYRGVCIYLSPSL